MCNFCKSLDLTLINCKIQLDFSQSKNSVISEISRTSEVGGANPVEATFKVNNANHTVPDATLSINNNNKCLGNIWQEFEGTISWNKYRSEKTTMPRKQ